MQLWQVTIKVRPAVDHPLFWEWQFGFLSVWLFGSSDDNAVDRALEIVAELPYEQVGEQISIRGPEPISPVPEFQSGAKTAREVGLALMLSACSPGVDEGDFETMEAP